MGNVFQDIEARGKARGEARGAYDKSIEIAEKLIERGKETLEEISALTGLPLEEVEALSNRKST